MKLTQKCVVLPFERYELLMKSSTANIPTPKNDSETIGNGVTATNLQEEEEKLKLQPKEPLEKSEFLNISKGNGESISPEANSSDQPPATLPFTPPPSPNHSKQPPPGLPAKSRKRKLVNYTKVKKRNSWKDLWKAL